MTQRHANPHKLRSVISRFLFTHTVLFLILLVLATAVVAFWHLNRLQEQLIVTMATQGARLQSVTMEELRDLYTSDVVEKVRSHGTVVTHDHQGNENTIPLPATLTIELGRRIGQRGEGAGVRLYSEYPFPWRKNGGPRDVFERDALKELRRDPTRAYSRIEQYQGQLMIRYASADLMRAQCISCHNTHPASPKRDWQEGEVRGVLEIIRPISPFAVAARDGLRDTLGAMVLIAVLGFAGVALIIGKQRRTAHALAGEIDEREQAEQSLHKLTREQQSILDHAGVGIAFLKSRHVVRCNHTFAAMFGYRTEGLIGLSTRLLHVSEQAYVANGEEAYAAVEIGGEYACDAQYMRRDGTVFWARMTLTAIDRADLSAGVIWVVHDIDQRKQAEQALARSEERFHRLTDLSSDWYWEQDENFRFTELSGGILAKGGTHQRRVIGKTRWDLPIDIEAGEMAAHRAVLEAHQPFSDLEYKTRYDTSEPHWHSISGEPLFDADGGFKGYRGTGKDITERKQAEVLRAGQGKVLEMIATGAPLEQVLANLIGLIESQSPGMVGSVLLLGDDQLHVSGGVAPDLPESYVKAFEGAAIGPQAGSCGTAMYRRERVIVTDIASDPLWADYRDFAAQYGLHACWSTPILSQQGKVLGTFGVYYREVRTPVPGELRLADIATRIAGIAIERKQAEERISFMAHHDMLTGLPNRTLQQDRVSQAIDQAERLKKLVAVLLIDLDYFKNINDSLGHVTGDQLLKIAAARLQQCLRKGDSLARLGGDEFIITLPALEDSNAAAEMAQKALDALERPFRIDAHELHVGGSIGISLYPADGGDAEVLMRAADTAMYHAKAKGRGNYQFFTSGLNAAAHHRLLLTNQLRQALGRGEFTLAYQPQLDIASGRIFSAEALLRWQQPERGFISPAEFIPVAEETGLILPLGDWVLREACAQLKRWRDAGYSDMVISVNLSARQVTQPGFVDSVARVLEQAGLPATALDLEITESILMQPSEDNLVPLTQLSNMGIQLSVDDFGTGYSSLSYLKRFPIHALKIDQSFVRGIGQAPDDMAIVTAIIAMAHSLNLKVIAEGVETAEQAAYLAQHGCPSAQGYYYSRPVPADQMTGLLRRLG